MSKSAPETVQYSLRVQCDCGHQWGVKMCLPASLTLVMRLLHRTLCPKCGQENANNIYVVPPLGYTITPKKPAGGRARRAK